MATYKIDDQTSFELEDGEEVVFKNFPVTRFDDGGCLMSIASMLTFGIAGKAAEKKWLVNIAVTNKRIVAVPIPPNEKNFPAESFYFSKMSGVKPTGSADASHDEASLHIDANGTAYFINFYPEGGYKKALKEHKAGKSGEWLAKVAASNDEKFNKVGIPEAMKTIDTSQVEHIQKRDFLVYVLDSFYHAFK